MGHIRKRDSKWQVRWTDPDGVERGRTCPTRRVAEALLREVEECVARGRRWAPRDSAPVPALRALIDHYLAECLTRNAEATVVRKEQFLGAWLDWFDLRLKREALVDDLSRAMLAEYHAHILRPTTGRFVHGRGRETVRKHIGEIELAWRWVWERGGDYGVEVPRPQRLRLQREPPLWLPAPTWPEMDAAIACLDGWRRRVCVVMRCTGLRVQQVMGLMWADLDLERATIHVRGELGKSLQERSGRVIPIAPVLVAELAGWGTREGWLVDCPHEHRIVRARDIGRGWERAGVRPEVWDGLPGRKGRPDHAFRAGFETGLMARMVRRETVDYLVGHSLGITAHYADPWAALGLREAVALVPEIGAEVVPSITAAGRGR